MDIVSNMLSFPLGDSIRCGPVTILWLTPDVQVSPADLCRSLTESELVHASKFKSAARHDEYLRTRWLIRASTGYSGPLRRDASGYTLWPDSYVGSITHKNGHVAFALAPKSTLAGLGIDAEDSTRMKETFETRICTRCESQLLDTLERQAPRTLWLTLFFSFKEALFKCHFPLGRIMFYFHDAELTDVDPGRGEIRGRLLKTTSDRTPKGHEVRGWFIKKAFGSNEFLITSCVEP